MTTFETIKFELQLDVDVDFSNEDLTYLICPFEVIGNIYDMSKNVDGKEAVIFLGAAPVEKTVLKSKRDSEDEPVVMRDEACAESCAGA
jgi:hypothetical protein